MLAARRMCTVNSGIRTSIIAGLFCLACAAQPLARAQPSEEPADVVAKPVRNQILDDELTQEERDKAYDDLAKEVVQIERQSNALRKIAKLARPAVVHIEAEKTEPSTTRPGKKKSVEEAGAGTIIDVGGKFFVLTNRHVIKAAELKNIKVRLADGRILTPTNVVSDSETDVAVLTVSATRLVTARIGDSDQTDIGDFVLAMGSPFGLSHSITHGIISAKGRRDLELGEDGVKYQDFMQTDAAINPGNSGGPLLNMRGEVIGMNTAIASSSGGSEGIGFTIPINMAMVIAKQLIERGAVVRAYLGVQLDSKFGPNAAFRLGLPRQAGTRVTAVVPNSPAEIAKLQADDVILEFNGVRIDDDMHLVNLISLTEVGKEVPVIIFRNKQVVNVSVKVAKSLGSK